MKKIFYYLLVLFLVSANFAQAQVSSLNRAKYITTLKVVSAHKLKDRDIIDDVDELRESERFNRDLRNILEKLDNSRPNSSKNQKIMRILEKAGREIYNELK